MKRIVLIGVLACLLLVSVYCMQSGGRRIRIFGFSDPKFVWVVSSGEGHNNHALYERVFWCIYVRTKGMDFGDECGESIVLPVDTDDVKIHTDE